MDEGGARRRLLPRNPRRSFGVLLNVPFLLKDVLKLENSPSQLKKGGVLVVRRVSIIRMGLLCGLGGYKKNRKVPRPGKMSVFREKLGIWYIAAVGP